MSKKRGCVMRVLGSPDHHSYFIRGEDGEEYFAHLGDIKANEEKLYGKSNLDFYLDEGDEVEFDVPSDNLPRRRVMHVTKIID